MPQHTPQVVVITDRRDAHVPFVQKHLDSPMIILDPQALLEGAELTFAVDGGTVHASYNGEKLDRVAGVWYRKPIEVSVDQLAVHDSLKPYVLTSMQRHNWLPLSAFRDALWVNEYYAMRRADSKAWQLEVAAGVGMRVPETVMTSDARAAQDFIHRHEHTIVKPQSAYSPASAGLQQGFLTTKIDKNNPPDLHNLHLAPAIFQQAIDTMFDVRVTVVGDAVFAAKITNPALGKDLPVTDWRLGHFTGDMRIEAFIDFPAEMAQKCVALVRALGLEYGAIDFVADEHGELWFLENNANGQWAFVEEATDMPIGKTLAEMLQGGKRPKPAAKRRQPAKAKS
jgi:glutathione synthase/RimK-type ligase-like ATP-grasp enzyme